MASELRYWLRTSVTDTWPPTLIPRRSGDDALRTAPAWQDALDYLRSHAGEAEAVSPMVRAVEIVVASILLILTSPLMAVIALIVKLDSPGPAVFRQPRVGRHGRLFRFAKFRTLYTDARERWPELYAYAYTPDQIRELHFKMTNDPRVTRVGRWLRKSTLDELPNLWNVLTGEVALVGPRPEIPEMLPYYDRETLTKFFVRPGVTGLAQVGGRGDLSFTDTVRFDVEYVQRRSLALDIEILFKTFICTIRRKGAF